MMTPAESPQHTSTEADDVNVKSNYVDCWKWGKKAQRRPLLPTPQVSPLVREGERS
ncbi:hypothetical protein [Cystobacter ferrugineus]|uniref:hypothetical protein n=1 Tax=Cystobacter ferrugineus TaxID=83449 RepID=UPI000AFD7816|nr:hypothetical protein [Cystobacter ferrugineus]